MKSLKVAGLLFYLLLGFNLVLAFSALWSLQRMTPVIDRIYERNVRSLNACDDMLAALNMIPVDRQAFEKALQSASGNVTEPGEQMLVAKIGKIFPDVLSGNPESRKETVLLIVALAGENRKAVLREIYETRHLRQSGSWLIVFFTLAFFSLCLLLEKRLRKNVIGVVEEISDVLESRKNGDLYRRCRLSELPPDMHELCSRINEMIDRAEP